MRRPLGLRAELTLTIILLVALVLVPTTALLLDRQAAQLRAESAFRAQSLQEQVQKIGATLAQNVALSCGRALAVLDYLFVSEVAEATLAQDAEVAYVAIMDRAGKPLVLKGHGEPHLPVAPLSPGTEQRRVEVAGEAILETSTPILVNGEPWGAVRLGLTLRPVEREAARSAGAIAAATREQLLLTMVGALVLLVIGSATGAFVLNRMVVRPLADLTGVIRLVSTDPRHLVEPERTAAVFARSPRNEVGELASAFRRMQVALASVIGRSHGAAQEVAEAASRLLEANRAVAAGSADQAGRLELALAEVAQMSTAFREVAAETKSAERSASEAAGAATEGERAATAAAGGLAAIRQASVETAARAAALQRASQRIGEIVESMFDFSEETNMLAINAGIEAARGGGGGKGLGVLASEIRGLAERGSDSAAEVSQIVAETQGLIASASAAIIQTDAAAADGAAQAQVLTGCLGDIMDRARRSNQAVSAIARVIDVQADAAQRTTVLMRDVAQLATGALTRSAQIVEHGRELEDVSRRLKALLDDVDLSGTV